MKQTPIPVALVGAGDRGCKYAQYALDHPDEMKIVAVVELDSGRRIQATRQHRLTEACGFETVEALRESGIAFTGVINATMDAYHVQTTLPLLKAGKHVLLEKPLCQSAEELRLLHSTAKDNNVQLKVCHVLRYAPFYVAIKEYLLSGKLGRVKNIFTQENISYHHMAAAYIRGRWANSLTCGTQMLMGKCSHDLDLLTWFKSGIRPRLVSSMGALFEFKPEGAPKGAGTKCLVDCPIEATCPYSARLHYIKDKLWDLYAFVPIAYKGAGVSDADKEAYLKGDTPYGRCVYHSDNNAEDVQSVIVQFEDGCVATHQLVGGNAHGCRTIHIIGTEGELSGCFEENMFTVKKPDYLAHGRYALEEFIIPESSEAHGGGDARLVADFVRTLNGAPPSLSSTSIEDSLYGHLIGFEAHTAMTTRTVAELETL